MTRYDVNAELGTVGANVASGDFTGLTVSKSPTGGSQTLTYSSTQAAHGSKSLRATAAAGETSIAILQPFTADRAAARMYLRLDSLPTVFTQLLAIRNSAGNMTIVGLDASGRFSVQAAGGVALGNDSVAVPTATWIRVELATIAGTTTSNGRVDAAWYTGDSTTANYTLTNAATNTGTTTVDNIRFAKPNSGGTFAGYVDDLAAADGSNTFLGPAGNVPPSANAGSDQTINAGTTLTLAGSAIDADGTITAYAWTKVSGPTVTITNASTATASVTAIPKGHYVFRLTVTDDGGATATDDVNVNVAGTSGRPDLEVSNAGAWVNVGGAASRIAALADESDTTYVESPDNPSGAVYEYRVEPLQAGQLGFTYRYQASAASPARSLLTELVMGTTVIASQTDTPSTSWVTGTITLSSTQQAAVTGRTDLRLRHTAS